MPSDTHFDLTALLALHRTQKPRQESFQVFRMSCFLDEIGQRSKLYIPEILARCLIPIEMAEIRLQKNHVLGDHIDDLLELALASAQFFFGLMNFFKSTGIRNRHPNLLGENSQPCKVLFGQRVATK